VLAVSRVVLLDEAIGVLPDRLEYAGPGVLDADVAGAAGARRNLVAVVVIDDRMDAGYAWPRAPGLHRVKGRHRAAQESTVLGLPPRVDDHRFALAHHIVVPPPHRRLDGLAHRRHMLEVVMVFCRLIGTGASKSTDCRRRGVK